MLHQTIIASHDIGTAAGLNEPFPTQARIAGTAAALPNHLTGTRAALFYLLRQQDKSSVPSRSVFTRVDTQTGQISARPVPETPTPGRDSLTWRDVLLVDDFEFRPGLGSSA